MEPDRLMPRIALCLTVCLTTTADLFAHPGHGVTEPGTAAHYLFEPLHLAPVLILAVTMAAGLWLRRRNDRDDDLHRERVRK
jgi:hypothetical protein